MNCFCPELAPAYHDHNLEYDAGHVFQRVSRGEVPEVEADEVKPSSTRLSSLPT